MEDIQKLWNEVRQAYASNRPATAVYLAKKLIAATPSHIGPAWKMLGSSLISMARYDEAEDAIEQAMKDCPDDKMWIPLCDMGNLNKDKGYYHLAATWFLKAAVACPLEASPHIYLGGIFAKMGEFSNAEAKFREATVCEQGCIDEAYLNLGFVLRAQERYGEAAEAFMEALKIDPGYEAAKLALEDVLFFVNRGEKPCNN